MSEQSKLLTNSKKEIALKTKQLQKDFETAKNALEQCVALIKLRSMLIVECQAWLEIMDKYQAINDEESLQYAEEANAHYCAMMDLSGRFSIEIDSCIDEACMIQSVMLREGKLKAPLIINPQP
jgi:hypothetical protein